MGKGISVCQTVYPLGLTLPRELQVLSSLRKPLLSWVIRGLVALNKESKVMGFRASLFGWGSGKYGGFEMGF